MKIISFLTNLQKISLSDKIFFIQHLQVMLKAGLSLSRGLYTLYEQIDNKRFKRIILNLYEEIEKGQSFSKSLAKYPKVFPEIFTNMIEAGEISGNLEEILNQLSLQMKKDHDLISKIKGAMTYPLVVIVAMMGIGITMIVFVLPKITPIFKEMNVALPLPTRILISTSDFIINNGIAVTLGFIILLALFIKFIKTKIGKKYLHAFFLRAPLISPIIKKVNLARFSRALSSLLKTDIPIVKIFQITAHVLGNVYYKEAVIQASQQLTQGNSIASSIKAYPRLFPGTVEQIIAVGEETGSLDKLLEEIAVFYEEEIDQTMKNLSSIIEPVLILILGGAVGAMAVAVIMPMYSLSQQI